MTFSHWLDTFLEEKGIDGEETLEVQGPSGCNVMPLQIVVDAMKQASPLEQRKIKGTFVRIDFANGDCRHFINHLAAAIAV